MKNEGQVHTFTCGKEIFIHDSTTLMFWRLNSSKNTKIEIDDKVQSISDFILFLGNIGSKKALSLVNKVNILSDRGFFVGENTSSDSKNLSLESVVINPSNTCNLNCWFCYAKDHRLVETSSLSFEEIKRNIDYFLERKKINRSKKPLGFNFFFTSDITKEFPLYLKINKYLDSIKKNYGFPIYLFQPPTNFVEPPSEFLEFVNQYGYLTITLDLTNQQQISEVLSNIKLLKQSVKLHCFIPIHPKIGDMWKIYNKFSAYFDFISLRPARLSSEADPGWNSESMLSFSNQLHDLTSKLLEMPENRLLEFISKIGTSDYYFRYIDRIISREKHAFRCPASRTAIAVGCDGFFYPCSGLVGQEHYRIGSLENGLPIEDKSRIKVKEIDDLEKCKLCAIRYVCGGPCLDWVSKQRCDTASQTNTWECSLNYALFKSATYFIYKLSKKFPEFIKHYAKKRKIGNRLNYPLDLNFFSRFFS